MQIHVSYKLARSCNEDLCGERGRGETNISDTPFQSKPVHKQGNQRLLNVAKVIIGNPVLHHIKKAPTNMSALRA